MTGAEYIARFLSMHGTTDAFGVPGGVVLDLIYALDQQDGIAPHLTYHEQSAGFAACGYAQASGRLGVAYATRGPGFTNLLTAVADAYFDSVPVLFLTAHASDLPVKGMRVMSDQEMDTCGMVRKIVKYSVRVDHAEDLPRSLYTAYHLAFDGRKGATFIDVATKVLCKEVEDVESFSSSSTDWPDDVSGMADELSFEIRNARRPVLLVGDGVRQADATDDFRTFLSYTRIPCISSRFSHDAVCDCENYFGYVGSHGIRAANFILSKADLIVAIGNRLNVSTNSFSFSKVFEQAKFLRYEIDESEFERKFPKSICRNVDINPLLKCLCSGDWDVGCHDDWMRVCYELRKELFNEDLNEAVESVARIMKVLTRDVIVVSDVGNHEFFVSRAAVLSKFPNRVLYSKSFGAMGSALGRSIGAYYAMRRPVVCFIGDQGFQFNVQELQYISMHKLPIIIVLLNNGVSGMIRQKEMSNHKENFLHVSSDTGFASPSMSKLMESYGITYLDRVDLTHERFVSALKHCTAPLFVDYKIKEDVLLTPTLPHGCLCQDLRPLLASDKYKFLNSL